jgi:sec-independent protein translocase protein TatA
VGPVELAIVLCILLLVFGATRVPEMGRSLGRGMREFKEGLKSGSHDDRELEEREPGGKGGSGNLPAT